MFTNQERGPEEAPQTIIGREDLVRPPKEQYFYTPHIGEVPEIAVPDFLPDLIGKIFLLVAAQSHCYVGFYQHIFQLLFTALLLVFHKSCSSVS